MAAVNLEPREAIPIIRPTKWAASVLERLGAGKAIVQYHAARRLAEKGI